MVKMRCKYKQTRRRTRFTYRRPTPSTKLCPFTFPCGYPRAMIWYVSSKQGSDAHDGQSLATAFLSVVRAIAAASPGDTILIAPGTYGQDQPARVSAARAANIVVAVAGG
jgi:hypothetical protein